MPKVLISYRQESEAHKGQVRALAERLRARLEPSGIEIVLDQFLLEKRPGGPAEGWPKWSARQVQESARVILLASPGWVECFTGKEPPDQGAGASCEAHVIWQELHDLHWKSDKHRVCLLDRNHAAFLPTEIRGFHRFFAPDDEDSLCAWVLETVAPPPPPPPPPPGVTWPPIRADFKHHLADRTEVFGFFQRMLAGQSEGKRILLIRADGNHGKTVLVEKFTEYAQGLVPWALVDLNGSPGTADVLAELNRELLTRLPRWIKANTLGDALGGLEDVARTRPLLLLFDTYEKSAEVVCQTLETSWLSAVRRAEGLCFVISGRRTRTGGQPVLSDWSKAHWAKWVHQAELEALPRPEDWEAWARTKHPALTREHIEALAGGLHGVPGQVAAALDTFGASLGKPPGA